MSKKRKHEQRAPVVSHAPTRRSFLKYLFGGVALGGGILLFTQGCPHEKNEAPKPLPPGTVPSVDAQQAELNTCYRVLYQALGNLVKRAKAEKKKAYIVLGEFHDNKNAGVLSLIILDILHELDKEGNGTNFFVEIGPEELKKAQKIDPLPNPDKVFNSRLTAIFNARKYGMKTIPLDTDENVQRMLDAIEQKKSLQERQQLRDSMQPTLDPHMVEAINREDTTKVGVILTGAVHSKAIIEGLAETHPEDSLITGINICNVPVSGIENLPERQRDAMAYAYNNDWMTQFYIQLPITFHSIEELQQMVEKARSTAQANRNR